MVYYHHSVANRICVLTSPPVFLILLIYLVFGYLARDVPILSIFSKNFFDSISSLVLFIDLHSYLLFSSFYLFWFYYSAFVKSPKWKQIILGYFFLTYAYRATHFFLGTIIVENFVLLCFFPIFTHFNALFSVSF